MKAYKVTSFDMTGNQPLARLNYAFALLSVQSSLCVDFVDGGPMLIHQCPEALNGTYSCAPCTRATFHLVLSSSCQDVVPHLPVLVWQALLPQRAPGLWFGLLSGIFRLGSTRHPSKKYMPGNGMISWVEPCLGTRAPVRALCRPVGSKTYVGYGVQSAA